MIMEKFYGKELQSWTKKPLKKGEGVRYYDGKGGSFELNKDIKIQRMIFTVIRILK